MPDLRLLQPRLPRTGSHHVLKQVMLMYFQRLEDLRIDADKTQEQIAEILNCQREVYRRYEKGIYELPVWALIKLAEYYQVSADYILGLTDKKNP